MQNAPREHSAILLTCMEHSAILLTCIKLPFVLKIFILSIFEWPLKTGFTVNSVNLNQTTATNLKVNIGPYHAGYFNHYTLPHFFIQLTSRITVISIYTYKQGGKQYDGVHYNGLMDRLENSVDPDQWASLEASETS